MILRTDFARSFKASIECISRAAKGYNDSLGLSSCHVRDRAWKEVTVVCQVEIM